MSIKSKKSSSKAMLKIGELSNLVASARSALSQGIRFDPVILDNATIDLQKLMRDAPQCFAEDICQALAEIIVDLDAMELILTQRHRRIDRQLAEYRCALAAEGRGLITAKVIGGKDSKYH